MALQRGVHLGVRHLHHAAGKPVVGDAQVAVDDGLESAALGQVFDRDRHCVRPRSVPAA